MSYAISFDATGGLSLAHHGIKGMRWGVRRYQNEDGSLTPAGRKRYGYSENLDSHQAYKKARKEYSKSFDKAYNDSRYIHITKKGREKNKALWDDAYEKADAYRRAKNDYKTRKHLLKVERSEEKTISEREKNLNKMQGHLDKRVAKGKVSQAYAEAKIKDFNEGTALVKNGYSKYRSVISDYGNAKIKAYNDPSFRKTKEYKDAVKGYALMRYLELGYGSPSGAALYYTFDQVDEYYKKQNIHP